MIRQRLRPSQLITTFGPGAILDLPDDAVMIAGIEHWFSDGNKPYRKVTEPRLQAALNVRHFRTPPTGSHNGNDVPFIRFPRWRVCPSCFRLSDRFRWPTGQPDLPPVPRCDDCNQPTHPARIVVACPKAHIDDFPWYRWAHRGKNCNAGTLFLKGDGKSAGLGDMSVSCTCGIPPRSLAGALGKDAMTDLRSTCQGRRPWLDDNQEACTEQPYALQRGASNIYFSVLRSALSIPPWSDSLQTRVASWWVEFPVPPPPDAYRPTLPYRFPDDPPERVEECIARLLHLTTDHSSIRQEEYQALNADEHHATPDFEAVRQDITPGVAKYLARLVAVPRLREVRALAGFTRIDAPDMDPTMELFDDATGPPVVPAPLSATPLQWLPATENLGEGFFLRLQPERLATWEALPTVALHANILLDAYSAWRQRRGLLALRGQTGRLVLLHTLAHLLMRQLSLDSGYSSASLRERIYAHERMAGILIYTSTPDSDGSLGGLVRQTKPPQRFEGALLSAIDLARLCSGDPLCREHDPRRTERLNAAACHACAMVSETSCEFGNRLLDRSMLVNLPNRPKTGFVDFDE